MCIAIAVDSVDINLWKMWITLWNTYKTAVAVLWGMVVNAVGNSVYTHECIFG